MIILKLDKDKIIKNIKKKIKEVSDNYMRNLSYEPLKPPTKENIRQMIKKEIRMRKSREIEAEIENIMFECKLYNTKGEYPLHINTNKKGDKHCQTFWRLSYGLNYEDIIDKTKYFADALTAQVNIEPRKGLLMIEVIKGIIPEKIQYEFNYIEHMDKNVVVPLGYDQSGLVVWNLEDIPHCLIAGVTHSGKSILLTGWVDALLQNPNVILFVIDLAMADFYHVKNYCIFGSTLDDAENILEFLINECDRRIQLMTLKAGVVKIQKYNNKYPNDKLPYLVLMIDEFAFTSPRKYDDKDTKKLRQRLQGMTDQLAQMARKAGIHLVVAMQRPSKELIPMEIKSNFPGAISFKTVNLGTSKTILENTSAFYLPRIKGRFMAQWESKQIEVQAMLLEQEDSIRRLKMYDKITDKMNVKGDDIYNRLWQYQIYEHTTKRLLPR